ncbi:polysaccharide biosynthesis protein [Xylophilus sp. GOD-11R]|uniref:lipopolysaccharide biosynthesis protein n=1 Tax=Xylophilus sp. GOD-11R TaxID=3089814 RepID=UPI00298C9B2D|nr:polysaccharide biosynthesis protein [Xylophilus sp. GOD-11R]WPB55488.1 polysaccharide biosynthesis protein [Xylophilus sp. GOD-11R]
MSSRLSQRFPLSLVIRSSGSWALASRMYVYLSGFVAVFLLSANVPAAQFGEYSIYQSALELGLIVGTLGSSIVFAKHATMVPPTVYSGDVWRTLSIGVPIAGLLIGAMLFAQGLQPLSQSTACILLSLVFFAFNTLRLAWRRGRGEAGLLNLEAGLRATMLISGIVVCLLRHEVLTVTYLLQVNLLSIVAVTIVLLLTDTRGTPPPPGAAALGMHTQVAATGYSLMAFVLRKADLLIVAFFMPLAYVGAFKLAFLLAEAPSQFVIAYLYTHTPAMLAARKGGTHGRLPLARKSLMLGLALFAGLALFLQVFGPLLKFGDEARSILLCLLPYFLLRTYTVHHEILLQLNTRLRLLGAWTLVEVFTRLLSYAAVLWAFPEKPHYVFFIATIFEFVSYELRARSVLGFLPCTRLWRR